MGAERLLSVSMTGEDEVDPNDPTKLEYARGDSKDDARYQGGGAVEVDATGESDVRRKAERVVRTASRACEH